MNQNNSFPRVAAVILPYNSLKYLPELFESLSNLDYPKDKLKILVVDNKSPEPEMDYLRANWPEVEIIDSGKNLGYAGGNNLGFKKAMEENYDYVWVLNPDLVLESDSLTKLVAVCEGDERIGLAQPKILIHEHPELIQTGGNKIHYLGLGYSGGYKQPADSLTGGPQAIAYASGACLLIKKAALRKIGFFTEEFFMYHEDLDLGWRAWLLGFKVVVVPTAVVYHKYSFSRNQQKYFWMERNRWWTILKNYQTKTLFFLIPGLLVLEICIWGQALLGGWLKWKFKSYLALLKNKNWLWQKRSELQGQRVLSDVDFLELTVGSLVFPDFDNFAVRLGNKFFELDRKLVIKSLKR